MWRHRPRDCGRHRHCRNCRPGRRNRGQHRRGCRWRNRSGGSSHGWNGGDRRDGLGRGWGKGFQARRCRRAQRRRRPHRPRRRDRWKHRPRWHRLGCVHELRQGLQFEFHPAMGTDEKRSDKGALLIAARLPVGRGASQRRSRQGLGRPRREQLLPCRLEGLARHHGRLNLNIYFFESRRGRVSRCDARRRSRGLLRR